MWYLYKMEFIMNFVFLTYNQIDQFLRIYIGYDVISSLLFLYNRLSINVLQIFFFHWVFKLINQYRFIKWLSLIPFLFWKTKVQIISLHFDWKCCSVSNFFRKIFFCYVLSHLIKVWWYFILQTEKNSVALYTTKIIIFETTWLVDWWWQTFNKKSTYISKYKSQHHSMRLNIYFFIKVPKKGRIP
jgi:hypothetical protein